MLIVTLARLLHKSQFHQNQDTLSCQRKGWVFGDSPLEIHLGQ